MIYLSDASQDGNAHVQRRGLTAIINALFFCIRHWWRCFRECILRRLFITLSPHALDGGAKGFGLEYGRCSHRFSRTSDDKRRIHRTNTMNFRIRLNLWPDSGVGPLSPHHHGQRSGDVPIFKATIKSEPQPESLPIMTSRPSVSKTKWVENTD